MNAIPPTRIRRLTASAMGFFLVVHLVACAQTATDVVVATKFSESQIVDLQTDDQRLRTLESIQKIDKHPLYIMKFYGDYAAEDSNLTSRISPLREGWACSLFAAMGSKEHPLYGRNFDWQNNPALVLLTDSPDGFASISMVDVSYLGYSLDDEKFDSIAGREQLLTAPLIPFDGMNECGLTVGMAAVDGAELPDQPDKPEIGSLRIIRLVLDRCRTVDEAIPVFEKYKIDFKGGPQIHYLLADAEGNSALIEFSGGKCHVLRNQTNWQAATNFYVYGNQEQATNLCGRYAQIKTCLGRSHGELSEAQAMDLLADVAQGTTRWSVVYDMKQTTADIVMSRRFDHPIRLSLADERPAESP